LARLIAIGEVPFPTDIHRDEQFELAGLVRLERRNLLLDFLARQIATEIRQDLQAKA